MTFEDLYRTSQARVVRKIGEASLQKRNSMRSTGSLPTPSEPPEPIERLQDELLSWAERVCYEGPSDDVIEEDADELLSRRPPPPGIAERGRRRKLPPRPVDTGKPDGRGKPVKLMSRRKSEESSPDESPESPGQGSGSGSEAGSEDPADSPNAGEEPASPGSPGSPLSPVSPSDPAKPKKAVRTLDMLSQGLSPKAAGRRRDRQKTFLSNRQLLEIAETAVEGNGMSEARIKKMSIVFMRFLAPGKLELHVDDVQELLRFLGHVITDHERMDPVVAEVVHPGFQYLDWDEFKTLMEKYVAFERKEFRRMFEEFDADKSGEISTIEMHAVMKALGFLPRHAMISEALAVVDEDESGAMSFNEFEKFLAIYSYTEGFTRTEVTNLRTTFEKSATIAKSNNPDLNGQQVLKPDVLADALVEVFGLQVSEIAIDYGKRLASGQGLQRSSTKPATGKPESLTFPEYLIFARKVREAQFDKVCEEFPDLHSNSEAVITLPQLHNMLGYTPLGFVVEEISKQVLPPDRLESKDQFRMDFDEFFDFMLIYRQQDGFLAAELEDLKENFLRFDDDGSGEVSALECHPLMIHMGMSITLDDLRQLIREVDVNDSGQLDFREFVHLIRLFREKELDVIKSAFGRYAQEDTQQVKTPYLKHVLADLEYKVPDSLQLEGIDELDFDRVVGICDFCRSILVSEERRKAGWTDMEIQCFKDLFDRFDADHSGSIDVKELEVILREFGWQVTSREQQVSLMKKLQTARQKSMEADVEDLGHTGEDGELDVRFWPFVQLMRVMKSERDLEEQELLETIQRDLRFSEAETEEFRTIFRMWVKKTKEAEFDGDPDDMPEEANPLGAKDSLPRDGLRRLIRSLGCSITPQWQDTLDKQVAEITGDRRLGAVIDFPQFLRLMRWLMDTDYAGINDRARDRGSKEN